MEVNLQHIYYAHRPRQLYFYTMCSSLFKGKTLEEIEKLQSVLADELKKETGYVLVLGAYEREGHAIIKGDLYEGEDLEIRGLLAVSIDQYQKGTQRRSVVCPECQISMTIPGDQDKFLCSRCKKEWELQLTDEEKRFEEFKAWSVGLAFWAEEKPLRDKVKDFLVSIPQTIKDKPESVTGPSGLVALILRILGVRT